MATGVAVPPEVRATPGGQDVGVGVAPGPGVDGTGPVTGAEVGRPVFQVASQGLPMVVPALGVEGPQGHGHVGRGRT